MKKIIYIIIALLTLQACQNFLDVQPRNTKIVSTIEDYRDILASYMRLLKSVNAPQQTVLGGYNYPQFDMAGSFSVYTGEARLYKENTQFYNSTLGEYTASAIDRYRWMKPDLAAWDRYYQFLGPINLIIGGIVTAEGTDEDLRNYVKGEALAWRAFAYFKLLQYYAPYKNDKYGIPVYLKPYDDPSNAMPERKTQTEVFRQILNDCNDVKALLELTPSNSWNCAYATDFIDAMMADIYTYKAMSAAAAESDWANAAKHADAAMQGRSLSNDPVIFKSIFNCDPNNGGLKILRLDEFFIRIIDGNMATLLSFKNAYCNDDEIYTNIDNTPDMDLYRKYRPDDIRRKVYFREKPDGTIIHDKYNLLASDWWAGINGGVLMPFRLAEMYLIKAEATMRQGKSSEAKLILDDFKRGRYTDIPGSYSESDLLNEILKERQLEFYQENDFWWLDMKRLGIKAERVVNGITYILEPDDFRYCLPIPESEMKQNLKMVQTPGWDQVFF